MRDVKKRRKHCNRKAGGRLLWLAACFYARKMALEFSEQA